MLKALKYGTYNCGIRDIVVTTLRENKTADLRYLYEISYLIDEEFSYARTLPLTMNMYKYLLEEIEILKNNTSYYVKLYREYLIGSISIVSFDIYMYILKIIYPCFEVFNIYAMNHPVLLKTYMEIGGATYNKLLKPCGYQYLYGNKYTTGRAAIILDIAIYDLEI